MSIYYLQVTIDSQERVYIKILTKTYKSKTKKL
jgi:hypothetical protein